MALSKEEMIELLKNELDEGMTERNLMIRDEFPKLGQHSVIIGATLSGKSFLIKYMLSNVYSEVFDQIFIFCPTIRKENYDLFDLPSENLIEDFDAEDLQRLFDDVAEKFVSSKGQIHTLFLFDDCTDKMKKFKNLPAIISTARQYSITLWFGSQFVNYLPPAARDNSIAYFIFPSVTDESMKKLGEATVGIKNMKRLMQIIREENDLDETARGLFYWNKKHFLKYWYLTIEDDVILNPIVWEKD